jgi:glycosyltransferase involved in cell wall biosynthesis
MLRQPKIAYIIKTFPTLSETFILNEILGLEKLGTEICSLRTPSGGPVHASVAEVNAKVTYVPRRLEHGTPPPLAGRILLAHLMLLLASPRRYRRTARFCRREHGDHWLKIFFQAVFMAHWLLDGGFHHLHAHFTNLATSVAEPVHHLISGVPYSFTAHAKDIYLTDPKELNRKMKGAACVLTCTAYNQRYLAAVGPQLPTVHLAYHGVDITRFACAVPRSRDQRRAFDSRRRPAVRNQGSPVPDSCLPNPEGSRLPIPMQDRRFRRIVLKLGRPHLRARRCELRVTLRPDGAKRSGPPVLLLERLRAALSSDRVRRPRRHPQRSYRGHGIGAFCHFDADLAIPELVDDMVNGILVAERDIRAIADAIELLCVQPALARRLGEQGRTKVLGRFALEASARRFSEFLFQAVEASRHRIRPSVRAVALEVGEDPPAGHTRRGDG